jgi:hypothetical protein
MPSSENEKPECSDVLAGDLQTGWDSTDRLPDRLESYSNLKESTSEFTDWARDGGIPQFTREETKLFRKVENCGSYLIFRNYLTSNRSRLIGACSCKEHLICSFCAARRGVRNARAYQERVEVLKTENPAQRLILVTFTVKNGPNLIERFIHLKNSMQSFLKRRSHSLRRDTPSSFHLVNGGVFAYEFKRGAGLDLWHPHIHMLILAPSDGFLDWQAVKDEWLSVTGDSSVVNFSEVIDDSAFLEVFAYALKFSEMSHQDRWYAFSILKGERLISSFGSFRGVEVPDSVTDDLADSDEPWVDLIFKYRKFQGYDFGAVVGRSTPEIGIVEICPQNGDIQAAA